MRLGVLLEQALAPVPGGTGRYAVELAAGLGRTAEPGDSVATWVAWHRDVRAASAAPELPTPRRLPLPRRALVAAWERGLGPGPRGVDVVHAPTLLFPPGRRPLVVTIHDAVPWTHPETLTPRGVQWHRAMAERAVRVADAIAVPTRAVAAELAEALPALRPDRVHVLGAGVTSALSAGTGAPEVPGLPDRYLLSLATLEPRKGLDVLLAALDRLGPGAPPLVVVGQPGWGGVEVDRPGVHALGRVPDAELAVILRRATALVMPSRAEGFGLPVVEAMAAGTPVICSDIPALAEVSGGAAALVPPGDPAALADAIRELMDDEPARHKLAEAGIVQAGRFDWDDVARRAWQLYRNLAARI